MTNERDDDDRDDIEGPVDDGEATRVPLEDPEPDDDDEEGEAAAAPAKKPTRREKKAGRGRLREELADKDRQIGELRERMARFEGRADASERQLREAAAQARSQGGDDDPLAAELDQVYEQVSALSERIVSKGNKISPEEEREFEKRARQLDQKKALLIARMAVRAEGGGRQPDPSAGTRQGLEIAYSDVYSNANAREWARGEFQRMVNHPDERQRRPAGLETVKLALEAARKEFGMGRPAPSQTERNRTSGVARGGTGGGDRDTHFEFDPNKNAHDLKMANAMYSHIKDPKERLKLYAKGPGKKILEEKRAASGRR